jgi:hypothetical protein
VISSWWLSSFEIHNPGAEKSATSTALRTPIWRALFDLEVEERRSCRGTGGASPRHPYLIGKHHARIGLCSIVTAMRGIPLGLKIAYTVFFVVWVPVVALSWGWTNYLWLCDVANFVLLVAIWRESPLLISSQGVAVLLVQLIWWIDFFTRLLLGFHPVGGTEYMFDPSEPFLGKGLSLFHIWSPLLLLWLLARLGYDRRGWKLQSALGLLIFPLSFLLPTREQNVNWVWEPFGLEQVWLPPLAYLAVVMMAAPLVIFLPTHRVLLTVARRRGWRIWGGEG